MMRIMRGIAALAVTTGLAGCSTFGQTGPRLPASIEECEFYTVEICGTWTLQGDSYVGEWEDGATATLEVTRFTPTELVLRRVDFGKNPDFTAVYTGTVDGTTARGSVTWSSPGNSRTGTWAARW